MTLLQILSFSGMFVIGPHIEKTYVQSDSVPVPFTVYCLSLSPPRSCPAQLRANTKSFFLREILSQSRQA